MAVKDIHGEGTTTPEAKNISNPNAVPEVKHEDDPTYWENKARAEVSKREYDEARRDRAQLSSGHVPETGGVKITGNIDVTEQSRLLREEAKERVVVAEKKIEAVSKELAETKELFLKTQLENYQKETQAQLAGLKEILVKLTSTEQKTFTDQVKDVKDAATALGISTPITSTGNAQTDLNIQLEMIKLQHAEGRAQREFEWKMRMDEREHQLEIKKVENEAAAKTIELEITRERNQLIGHFPQMIGKAVARGLTTQSGEEAVTEKPVTQKQDYVIEAAVNEQGSINCPRCKTHMMFGPTSEKAVCAGCNTEVPIKRTGTSVPETDQYLYGPPNEKGEE